MRRATDFCAVLVALIAASCGGATGLSKVNDGSASDGDAEVHVSAPDSEVLDVVEETAPADASQTGDGAIADGASADLASDALPADASPADGSSDGDLDGAGITIGAGCGKPLPVDQPMTVPSKPIGYMHYTVTGTGATLDGTIPEKAGPRTFWVRVPADYNPRHKYRVVYIGQGCGGSNVANTATYALFSEQWGGDEQAIYVAMDIPTDMANADCYDNRDGLRSQEWEAFELFHSLVDATYCVDNDNVFVAGNSTGGWLANMWGCYFAGDGQHPWNGQAGGPGAAEPRRFAPRYHIRGQAVTSAGEPDNNPPCNGPVAALWLHDVYDSAPIAGDQAALARVLRMNGCEGSGTAPWHEDVIGKGICVQYTSCPTRYPVVFCTTSDHPRTNHDSMAIPAFTLLFDEASGVVRHADAGTN